MKGETPPPGQVGGARTIDDTSIHAAASPLHIPDTPADADTLTAALKYAAAGWYVVPIKRGSKNPGSVVGKGWHHQSSRDDKVIASWFAGTDHGVAIHVGRSGAVVLDVDDPAAFPAEHRDHLTTAPYQATRPDEPRRGHYIFTAPPGRTIGNGNGRLGSAWGEVRGTNGVIVAAPSEPRYQWRRTGAAPVLPAELGDLLDDATPAADAATDAAVAEFLAAHTAAADTGVLNGLRAGLQKKIDDRESVHIATLSAVAGAMKEAAAGYYPSRTALDTLKPLFMAAAAAGGSSGTKPRTGAVAESEWAGIVAWGVAQALAADPDDTHKRLQEKVIDPYNSTSIEPPGPPPPVDAPPMTLDAAHAVFRKWLGDDYDTDALDAMLAAVAVERLNGDPLWLLIISGPGNAKTETVQACSGVGAAVVSSISSEAALLSATPKRDRAKNATGGLLRQVGGRGVVVIKDVTSILSMDRNLRGQVLAALREVYDGAWRRDVGADGGQTLQWRGRLAVIGAVTTAWDTAHAVVSTMGDRFVLVRVDSTKGRAAAGRKAIGNTGGETTMRAELAAAVAGVIAGMNTEPADVTDAEVERLLAAADLVTLARTGVEYDYRGDVIDAHAPEMPTRFAKQLAQIVRGATAIGVARGDALRLAVRCARDSMPPLRLAIIDYLAEHPRSATPEVRRGIDKPRNTVDRQLQALHMLGVAACEEVVYGPRGDRVRWLYRLADHIDPAALDPQSVPDLLVDTPSPLGKSVSGTEAPSAPTHITGTLCAQCGGELAPDREVPECLDCAWSTTPTPTTTP